MPIVKKITSFLLVLAFISSAFYDSPKIAEAAPDITSNLTFKYDFENTSDLGNDVSSNNNDASKGTGVVAYSDGTRGNVAKFTKASAQDYFVTPVNNPTTSFTQAAWVNITDVGGNHSIFGTASGFSGNSSYMYVQGSRVITASNQANAAILKTTLGTISNNTWYHIARVYNSTQGKLYIYVNGVLWRVGTVVAPASNRVIFGSYNQPITFNSSTSTLAMGGYLDNVRQYSRALTEEDIRNIYFTEGGTVSTPTNVSAYPLDNGVSLIWDEGPVTDYVIEYKLSTDSSWTTFSDGTSTHHGTIVTGLTNGLSYDFRVSATDGSTTSAASSTVTSTPVARGLWVPLFVHDSSGGAVFSSATRFSEAKLTNASAANPLTQSKFSVLSHVENFRDSGDSDKMTFKIMYPDFDSEDSTIWKQSSNPADDTTDNNAGVTGYSEILMDYYLSGPDFIGLEYNNSTGGPVFIDGGISSTAWFAIGQSSLSAYNGTNGYSPNDFQGPQGLGVNQVQLFVKNPNYAGVAEKPLNVRVIPGNNQAYIYWQSVIADPVVTDYKIEYKLSSSGTWLTFADGVSTTLHSTVTGLSNSSSYDFRVSAVNSSGDGAVSDTVTKTVGAQIFYQILSNGQSLALGSKGTPPISNKQPYDNFMPYGDPAITNNAGPVGKDSPLIPLVETFEYLSEGLLETPSSGIANTLAAFDDAVSPSRRFVIGLHALGGSGYSVIKKNGSGSAASYGRGQTQASVSKTYVENTFAGIYRPLASTLVHGETDAALGNGSGNPSAYEGYLSEMQQDYESDFNTLTGRNDHIPLFYSQQNSAYPHQMAVAQLRAHRTYDDDIYLIGPTYQYPYAVDGGHLQAMSYRRLGEQFAKVMNQVLFENEDWDPLMPKVVARNGSNVYVWLNVPVPPVVFDTTNVVQRTDGKYGFEFIQTGGTTTLSSVSIVDDDVVKAVLSGTPDGTTPRLKYAAQILNASYQGDPTNASKSGGNMRDSDASVSPSSDSSGYPLYNWGVSFDETITTDSSAPVVTINAPTKSSPATITNTTIQVIDDVAVIAEDVTVAGSTTAGTSGFACTQTSNTQVDCVVNITSSGDLVINAVDLVERTGSNTEAGYSISSDSTAPTITNVSSDKANGSYTVGEVIDIDVTFSESVTSTGNVTVTLETGATDRTCTFAVSASTTGTCNYTVQSGDASSDLTVNSISGTIADGAANAMSNFAPATNLASNKAIVIDTANPTVSSLSPLDNATGVSATANLVINFDAPVDAETGNITIKKTSDDSTIETIDVAGGFVSGSGTSTITINPSVTLAGETEYYILIAATAFYDTAGNSYAGIASTTSWSFTTADVTAPTVTNVSSDKSNGAYTIGEVIDIDVTFSESVTSTGSVTVTLETGATDRTCTFSVSGASSGTCNYTVQSGDTTPDLTVNSISGTIADAAGNAMVSFGPATNLASNKAIVIDTANPTVSSLSPSDNATGVSISSDLSILFDAPVDAETGNITIKKTSDDSTVETIAVGSGAITGSGTNTITINPTADLSSATEYYILIAATAFDDTAGNSYAGIASTTSWSFTTADVGAPAVAITAPTKSSNAVITNTTIQATDDAGVLVADVIVAGSTTAGTSGFSCTQTSATVVDCTINITSSGNLTINVEDSANNTGTDTEIGYVIDATAPAVDITAITKSSSASIADTTILVTDNIGVSAADVSVDGATTAGTSGFSCVQTSATQVDCSIAIDSTGNLIISAEDSLGNTGSDTETGYLIDQNPPSITINAPTKTSNGTITDTEVHIVDDEEVLVAGVSIGSGTTADTSSFVCSQTSATVVDCTLDITSSGNLEIEAEDSLSNTDSATENNYIIDTIDPAVTITPVTLTAAGSITDTTIRVIDDIGLASSGVSVAGGTTAGLSGLSCSQTSATQVDCTITITSSGALSIEAEDSVGNVGIDTQAGYVITEPVIDEPVVISSGGSSRASRSALSTNTGSPQSNPASPAAENNCQPVTITSAYVKLGDRGANVVKVQKFLLSKGYAIGVADGAFGAKTKNAVIDFQKKNGLVADGVVGKATLSKTKPIFCSGSVLGAVAEIAEVSSCQFSQAKKGDKGENVKLIQQFLSDEGYLKVVPSGIFGPATEEATKKFQSAFASEILAPAGIKSPTGWFYGNTIKKAKELCS